MFSHALLMFPRGRSVVPLVGPGRTYWERTQEQRLEHAAQVTGPERRLSGCARSSSARGRRTSSERFGGAAVDVPGR